jgi:hypothetical protein
MHLGTPGFCQAQRSTHSRAQGGAPYAVVVLLRVLSLFLYEFVFTEIVFDFVFIVIIVIIHLFLISRFSSRIRHAVPVGAGSLTPDSSSCPRPRGKSSLLYW